MYLHRSVNPCSAHDSSEFHVARSNSEARGAIVLRLVINLKLSFCYVVVRSESSVYTDGGNHEHEMLLKVIGKKDQSCCRHRKS
jgi:hypothetical protein